MPFIPTIVVTQQGDILDSFTLLGPRPVHDGRRMSNVDLVAHVAQQQAEVQRRCGHRAAVVVATETHHEVRVVNQHGHRWTVHVQLTFDVVHPSSVV